MGIDLSTGHHVGWQAARALVLGWAGKRTGSVAAGWLTCAMPEPISPPPMTVTCLTTIFFAEAEAVDEEAMARMKCLVTKAMLRKSEGRRSRGDGGQRGDKGNEQGKNGEVTAAHPPAARGLLRAEAQAAPPPARPGHHQPAPAAGRDASLAPPIGRGHPDGVQTLERGAGRGPRGRARAAALRRRAGASRPGPVWQGHRAAARRGASRSGVLPCAGPALEKPRAPGKMTSWR